jgi:hypothetical protein
MSNDTPQSPVDPEEPRRHGADPEDVRGITPPSDGEDQLASAEPGSPDEAAARPASGGMSDGANEAPDGAHEVPDGAHEVPDGAHEVPTDFSEESAAATGNLTESQEPGTAAADLPTGAPEVAADASEVPTDASEAGTDAGADSHTLTGTGLSAAHDATETEPVPASEPVPAAGSAPVAGPDPAAGPATEPASATDRTPHAYDAPAAEPADSGNVAETPLLLPPEPSGIAAEPAASSPPAAAPTPVFVVAPTPPKARGNRLMGILIDVVATVAFAIVFAAVALGLYALNRPHLAVDLWERYLQTPGFWVPVVVFFLAYALLIAIVNRGRWVAYIVGSFFVGVIVYFGYIGGALLTVHAWQLSLENATQFLGTLWANPLTLAAAIVAREASLWFGAWIAARGRRVRAANLEAQREYDRRLAAGPTGGQSTTS